MIPGGVRLQGLVWLQGAFRSPERARISVFDHALLYGDSVYETLRTHHGQPLFLQAHLRRLARSAALVGIDLPPEVRRVPAIAREARERLRASEVVFRIVITRGIGPAQPDPTVTGTPQLLVYCRPFVTRPEAHYRRGVSALISRHRRTSARSIPSAAKTGNFLAHVLAVAEARAAGADEALMLSSEGLIAEGATSNLFWVRRGVLETPRVATGILPGITRRIVIGLARRLGLRVREVRARRSRPLGADEAFLTNSTGGVIPLTRVDGRAIGDGRPGPITIGLMRAYAEYCDRVIRA